MSTTATAPLPEKAISDTPATPVAPVAAAVAPAGWALSESQRMHLDLYGYVVLPSLFDRAQVAEIRGAMEEIEQRYHRDQKLPGGSFASLDKQEIFRVDNLPHLHPCFHRYLCHPTIISAVEEMVGGACRIEQSDAHVRRPCGESDMTYAFHRGAYDGLGYTEHALYHFPFVKALTNLTDLGPDDGGTAVIPGSHKLHGHLARALKTAALSDPSLVHQVVAPAGSTLLFFESLLHSSGIIRSRRERALIIGGYTTTHFQAWAGYDPDPSFLATLSDEERRRYSGSDRWGWRANFRSIT
jgi:ectoine hydroxylase-related dioxygenase (phytanoyl-CoA dioxygenase family)